MRITEPREITREMHIFSHDLAWFSNSYLKFSFKHLTFCIPHLIFDISTLNILYFVFRIDNYMMIVIRMQQLLTISACPISHLTFSILHLEFCNSYFAFANSHFAFNNSHLAFSNSHDTTGFPCMWYFTISPVRFWYPIWLQGCTGTVRNFKLHSTGNRDAVRSPPLRKMAGLLWALYSFWVNKGWCAIKVPKYQYEQAWQE